MSPKQEQICCRIILGFIKNINNINDKVTLLIFGVSLQAFCEQCPETKKTTGGAGANTLAQCGTELT